MTHKEPMMELDTARNQLKCGTDILWAIHIAMTEGSSKSEDYADALYGAWNYLSTICKEISSCVDDCFEQLRAEKGNVA